MDAGEDFDVDPSTPRLYEHPEYYLMVTAASAVLCSAVYAVVIIIIMSRSRNHRQRSVPTRSTLVWMTMDIAYDTTARLGGSPPYHHKKPMMTTARNEDATFPSLACDPPMPGGANSSDTSDCPCMYDDGKNNGRDQ